MFGRSRKISLDPGLYVKATQHAEAMGYDSVDEFVSHLVDRELNRTRQEAGRDDITARLKGLGYL